MMQAMDTPVRGGYVRPENSIKPVVLSAFGPHCGDEGTPPGRFTHISRLHQQEAPGHAVHLAQHRQTQFRWKKIEETHAYQAVETVVLELQICSIRSHQLYIRLPRVLFSGNRKHGLGLVRARVGEAGIDEPLNQAARAARQIQDRLDGCGLLQRSQNRLLCILVTKLLGRLIVESGLIIGPGAIDIPVSPIERCLDGRMIRAVPCRISLISAGRNLLSPRSYVATTLRLRVHEKRLLRRQRAIKVKADC